MSRLLGAESTASRAFAAVSFLKCFRFWQPQTGEVVASGFQVRDARLAPGRIWIVSSIILLTDGGQSALVSNWPPTTWLNGMIAS